eukprot:scaffold1247_cov251-Pinguiococcus_pyrenoidosus.AAC.1
MAASRVRQLPCTCVKFNAFIFVVLAQFQNACLARSCTAALPSARRSSKRMRSAGTHTDAHPRSMSWSKMHAAEEARTYTGASIHAVVLSFDATPPPSFPSTPPPPSQRENPPTFGNWQSGLGTRASGLGTRASGLGNWDSGLGTSGRPP